LSFLRWPNDGADNVMEGNEVTELGPDEEMQNVILGWLYHARNIVTD